MEKHYCATDIGILVMAAQKLNEAGLLISPLFEEVRDKIFALCSTIEFPSASANNTESAEIFSTLEEALNAKSISAARLLVAQLKRGSHHNSLQRLCEILMQYMYQGYPVRLTGEMLSKAMNCHLRTINRQIIAINEASERTRLRVCNDGARGYFIERF